MDVDEIRAFVIIAQSGSFGRAAATLHRSQPAISRRIELLEGEFGIPLFERLHTGIILTEAGRALLPYAQAALAAIADGAEAVRALHQDHTGAISLALVGTLASTEITEHLREFRQQHPKVQLDLRTASSAEVSELVRQGEVTFGLRYFADSSPMLASEVVRQERLVVVCAADHRLAKQPRCGTRDLLNERWITFPSRGRSRESFARILERQLTAAGLEDAEILPIDSLTAQKRLVEAGFGIALLTTSSIQEEIRLGSLKVLDIEQMQVSVPVAIIYRRRGYLSAAARVLLSSFSAESAPP